MAPSSPAKSELKVCKGFTNSQTFLKRFHTYAEEEEHLSMDEPLLHFDLTKLITGIIICRSLHRKSRVSLLLILTRPQGRDRSPVSTPTGL